MNCDENNVLRQLNEDLNNCMDNGKYVMMHVCRNRFVIRDCIIPEEVNVDTDGIYVINDKFQISIQDVEIIEFIEEENSYYIKSSDIEVVFDLL